MGYTIHFDEEYEQYIKNLNIDKCPRCGGHADNGFDRCYPPNPYNCTKCEKAQTKFFDNSKKRKSKMLKAHLEETKKNWKSGIVARSAVREFTGGLYGSRHLSNMDYVGKGPAEKYHIGGKVVYSVDGLIEWLCSQQREESKVE